MREADLHAVAPSRKTPRTTDRSHNGPTAPNLLKNMEITHANQVWAMDITYVFCGQGWVYLAAVLDLYLHKIVGWQLADHMESSLIIDALQMAAQRQNGPAGVVVYSDRGSQYAAVRSRVFDYIETYYNRCSIHTALGMSPPAVEIQSQSKTPSAGCSPAEPASVSLDNQSIQQTDLSNNNKKRSTT